MIVGVCISVKFIARTEKHYEKYLDESSVPMLILLGALIIYVWPIYLIYYFYNSEE